MNLITHTVLRYPILQTIWIQIRLLLNRAVWSGFILFASIVKTIQPYIHWYTSPVKKIENSCPLIKCTVKTRIWVEWSPDWLRFIGDRRHYIEVVMHCHAYALFLWLLTFGLWSVFNRRVMGPPVFSMLTAYRQGISRWCNDARVVKVPWSWYIEIVYFPLSFVNN